MTVRAERGSAKALEVLVVDDSAVARQALAAVLSQLPEVHVLVASHPELARARMRRHRPDVLVLDLLMPGEDGLSFLRQVMREDPLPVVVCSSLGGAAETVVQALQLGAVEVVLKPRLGAAGWEGAEPLLDAVRAAARARRVDRTAAPANTLSAVRPGPAPERLVVIGASTGGPEAITTLLTALPGWAPPIAIAQHMPSPFTRAFADQLARSCRIEVKEAADGDALVGGRALIAPGGRQLRVERAKAGYVARLGDDPAARHRPSADVLFRSAAAAAGANGVGILLTGMGADGAAGLLEMRQAGARTVVQDEASSVVFGMPREAIALGAADLVVPLSRIAGVIVA